MLLVEHELGIAFCLPAARLDAQLSSVCNRYKPSVTFAGREEASFSEELTNTALLSEPMCHEELKVPSQAIQARVLPQCLEIPLLSTFQDNCLQLLP